MTGCIQMSGHRQLKTSPTHQVEKKPFDTGISARPLATTRFDKAVLLGRSKRKPLLTVRPATAWGTVQSWHSQCGESQVLIPRSVPVG
jgi:hypothetical protein